MRPTNFMVVGGAANGFKLKSRVSIYTGNRLFRIATESLHPKPCLIRRERSYDSDSGG